MKINLLNVSVRGLSLDFVFLNITGFTLYSVYNVGLYWFNSIQVTIYKNLIQEWITIQIKKINFIFLNFQQQYLSQYPQAVIPVQLNDVVFSLHALFACAIIVIQCIIYDRGSQTVSITGKILLCTITIFIIIICIVTLCHTISWLAFLTWCSYVKLAITLIKYVPQAYLNWNRKSTSGWCIGNVLLDFSGGVFSLVQMIMLAYIHSKYLTNLYYNFRN